MPIHPPIFAHLLGGWPRGRGEEVGKYWGVEGRSIPQYLPVWLYITLSFAWQGFVGCIAFFRSVSVWSALL